MLHFALAHLLEHRFQLGRLLFGELHVAELALTEQRDFARLALVRQHHHVFARARHVGQALDLDRDRRAGFGDGLAGFVEHGTHAAEHLACQHHVAAAQGAGLHQQRGDRALALVQTRFDDDALGGAVGGCLQFQHFGLQQDGIEQAVDIGVGLGRHFDELGIAAPFFGGDALRDQFLADALGVGIGFVDLVHRHHQRHTGRLGMVDGFDGLRHDAVVRRHHQHHDVGRFGAACTHRGKRFVTRGVEEGDDAFLGFDVIRADVLGDAAGFAAGHPGAPDGVEQRGFAVVDVTHDGDDRRTGDAFRAR